jgi:hypothetical protein
MRLLRPLLLLLPGRLRSEPDCLLLLLLLRFILMKGRVMSPSADTAAVVTWAGLYDVLGRQAVQTQPFHVNQPPFFAHR